MGGHNHAAAHGLAMQPLTVTQPCFNGVAKSMPKIQNRAQTRLAFIAANHLGFDLAAAFDGLRQHVGITCQQGLEIDFDPFQESHVRNRTVLDHFGQSGAQLTPWQRFKHRYIANHEFGLVKRANHVFAERMVDAGFSAN